MARGDNDLSAVYQCVCGDQDKGRGKYSRLSAHMRWSPACRVAGGFEMVPGTSGTYPVSPNQTPAFYEQQVAAGLNTAPPEAPAGAPSIVAGAPARPAEVPEDEETGPAVLFDLTNSGLLADDPEIKALQMLRALESAGHGNGYHGGNGYRDDEGGIPPDELPGALVEDPDARQSPVSIHRVPVMVPIALVQYYDYCRARGWKEGDGTFSDFVTAFLLSHFRDCLALGIGIYNLEQVVEVEETR